MIMSEKDAYIYQGKNGCVFERPFLCAKREVYQEKWIVHGPHSPHKTSNNRNYVLFYVIDKLCIYLYDNEILIQKR